MTATEAAKGRADLKSAGCPDDLCDKLLALPGITGGILAQILAWIQAHPGVITDIWTLIQLILSGANPPVPTP